MAKTICLLAHDAAPSQCFDQLELALRSKSDGIKTIKITGNGRPITNSRTEIVESVKQSNLLLLGMSSAPEFAESEIIVGAIARDLGIPYGFYSDMPLCPYRARTGAWFQDLAESASFLFGLLPSDTRRIGSIFPNARSVNTGNPLRDTMAFPSLSRKEVREKLGIKAHEKLILAPGGKFVAGNSTIWTLIINALFASEFRKSAVVILSPHPGDTALRTVDSASGKKLNFYEEIVADSPIQARYVTKDVLTTLDMVAGADLVIEFTGSTSICACVPTHSSDSCHATSVAHAIRKGGEGSNN